MRLAALFASALLLLAAMVLTFGRNAQAPPAVGVPTVHPTATNFPVENRRAVGEKADETPVKIDAEGRKLDESQLVN